MAPTETAHSFHKLRLETNPAIKPAPSPFSSIKHGGRELAASSDGTLGDGDFVQASPSGLPPRSDLTEFTYPRQDKDRSSSWQHNRPTDDMNQDGHAVSVVDNVEFPALRAPLRKRGTSVSFDPQVTLDSGHRLFLDDPLPRKELSLQHADRPEAQRMAHDYSLQHCPERGYSESEMLRYDAHTGELLDGEEERRPLYRSGEPRHPLLQTTVDELAQDPEVGEYERLASLTSGATASSSVDEPPTPPESGNGYLLSLVSVSSPIEFAPTHSSLPSHRSATQLSSTRNHPMKSSTGSLRRVSRRSTARSASSSRSPASAFLSQWGKEEAAAITTQPDDEGQEIGDHSEYIIGRQIGFGGFSVVKEVYTIEDGRKVVRAVKIVRKSVAGKSEAENEKLQAEFEHEVSIWRFLHHRYILPLIAVYDSPFATFCITQLNKGGTLFDLVRSQRRSSTDLKRSPGLPSHLAKRYIYQLASALRYLHEDVRIVHRDIKLENCLLDMSAPEAATEGGNILLCDFGMADFITNEHRDSPSPEPYGRNVDGGGHRNIGPSDHSTSIGFAGGSLQYAAPELINTPYMLYSTAVDMWAFGVVCYALLTGDLPFQHGFEPKLAMLILRGNWDEEALRRAPAVLDGGACAVELVKACLDMDPERRWSVGDVLDSDWLVGCRELYGDEDSPWS